MDDKRTARALTHDEQKAAEAAFGGRPFNPSWSASAKQVYDGLTRAIPKSVDEPPSFTANESERPSRTDTGSGDSAGSNQAVAASQQESGTEAFDQEQAVQSGLLIDVTADAKKLGIKFAVAMTKPLWDAGIAPEHAESEQEQSQRLRDVLMAFRLRLANQSTISPLIDFPALLTLSPDPVPQAVPLFALIQTDKEGDTRVTLLLPSDVSTTIIPLN